MKTTIMGYNFSKLVNKASSLDEDEQLDVYRDQEDKNFYDDVNDIYEQQLESDAENY